jgi:hypothetical protein
VYACACACGAVVLVNLLLFANSANILLSAGCSTELLDHQGGTLLHSVAVGGDLSMVKSFIDAGANPAAEDNNGLTPGDHALEAAEAKENEGQDAESLYDVAAHLEITVIQSQMSTKMSAEGSVDQLSEEVATVAQWRRDMQESIKVSSVPHNMQTKLVLRGLKEKLMRAIWCKKLTSNDDNEGQGEHKGEHKDSGGGDGGDGNGGGIHLFPKPVPWFTVASNLIVGSKVYVKNHGPAVITKVEKSGFYAVKYGSGDKCRSVSQSQLNPLISHDSLQMLCASRPVLGILLTRQQKVLPIATILKGDLKQQKHTTQLETSVWTNPDTIEVRCSTTSEKCLFKPVNAKTSLRIGDKVKSKRSHHSNAKYYDGKIIGIPQDVKKGPRRIYKIMFADGKRVSVIREWIAEIQELSTSLVVVLLRPTQRGPRFIPSPSFMGLKPGYLWIDGEGHTVGASATVFARKNRQQMKKKSYQQKNPFELSKKSLRRLLNRHMRFIEEEVDVVPKALTGYWRIDPIMNATASGGHLPLRPRIKISLTDMLNVSSDDFEAVDWCFLKDGKESNVTTTIINVQKSPLLRHMCPGDRVVLCAHVMTVAGTRLPSADLKTPFDTKNLREMYRATVTGKLIYSYPEDEQQHPLDAITGSPTHHVIVNELSIRLLKLPPKKIEMHPLDRAQSFETNTLNALRGETCQRLSTVLRIPKEWAEMMLETFNFQPNLLLDAWEKEGGEESVCRQSGVPYRKLNQARKMFEEDSGAASNSANSTNSTLSSSSSSKNKNKTNRRDPPKRSLSAKLRVPSTPTPEDELCLICYCEDPNLVSLGCGHLLCPDCWESHINNAILGGGGDGNILRVMCPMFMGGSCDARVPFDMIQQYGSVRATQLRSRFALRSFVDGNASLKKCPGIGCDSIIERMRRRDVDELRSRNVEHVIAFNGAYCDQNLHFFCFECGNLPHDPVSCAMFDQWCDIVFRQTGIDPRTGLRDDAATRAAMEKLSEEWMKKNTRPCPKCVAPVLKMDGCNHMTCRNPSCKHQWCWICRKDWSQCGGTWDCKQMGADFKGATKNTDANSLIARNLEDSASNEAFSKFTIQENSMRLEQKLLDQRVIQRRIQALGKQGMDGQFILDGIISLLKNRMLLRGLVAFRYFLFGQASFDGTSKWRVTWEGGLIVRDGKELSSKEIRTRVVGGVFEANGRRLVLPCGSVRVQLVDGNWTSLQNGAGDIFAVRVLERTDNEGKSGAGTAEVEEREMTPDLQEMVNQRLLTREQALQMGPLKTKPAKDTSDPGTFGKRGYLRHTLRRQLQSSAGDSSSNQSFESMREMFFNLHDALYRSTEALANVAGRSRTLHVSKRTVVSATEGADFYRRLLKEFMRSGPLAELMLRTEEPEDRTLDQRLQRQVQRSLRQISPPSELGRGLLSSAMNLCRGGKNEKGYDPKFYVGDFVVRSREKMSNLTALGQVVLLESVRQNNIKTYTYTIYVQPSNASGGCEVLGFEKRVNVAEKSLRLATEEEVSFLLRKQRKSEL